MVGGGGGKKTPGPQERAWPFERNAVERATSVEEAHEEEEKIENEKKKEEAAEEGRSLSKGTSDCDGVQPCLDDLLEQLFTPRQEPFQDAFQSSLLIWIHLFVVWGLIMIHPLMMIMILDALQSLNDGTELIHAQQTPDYHKKQCKYTYHHYQVNK